MRREEAGKAARPSQAAPPRAAGGVRRGSRGRRRLPRAGGRWRGARGACGPGAEAHGSPAVPGLRLCASSMAEGRRREDEEEELRERREFGGPRRARGRALSGHSAAGEGRGRREGLPGRRGPKAGRPGAAQVLPRTAATAHPPGCDRHLSLCAERRRKSGFSILVLTFGPSPREIQTGRYLLVVLAAKPRTFRAR